MLFGHPLFLHGHTRMRESCWKKAKGANVERVERANQIYFDPNSIIGKRPVF